MKINLPILFSQFDSRWAQLLLGFNTNAKYNFYNYACLVSTLAEIARYYGHDDTPQTINEKLKSLGIGVGFAALSGDYIWGAITKLYPDIKERKTETPSKLTDAQIGEIKSAIDKGFPVMVQIDVNPKTAANDTHYSALVDYDPQDENNFSLADTLGGQIVSLKKYLGWLRPSARESIYKYVIYEGKVPTGQQTVAVPADIYPKIIHNSTEYDKVVKEYLPDNDPTTTQFEDVRAVVGGYKSRATQMENERNEAQKQLSLSTVEVQNQKDKVANVEADCQIKIDTINAELSALKQGATSTDKLVGSLRGQIDTLSSQLREAQKQGGLKDLEIAKLGSDLNACQNGLPNDQGSTLQKILTRLLELLANIGKK